MIAPPSGPRLPGWQRPCVLAPAEGAPPRRYVPFLWASLGLTLTFGTTLGAINIARLTGTWGFLSRPSVWAHGYAQFFGFFALFIMGFACHALPRFVGAALRWPALATAALWLQVGGVVAVAGGWVFLPEGARLLWFLGAVALVAGAVAFLLVVVGTLRGRARPPESFERWMVAGASWLVAGALLALVAAAQDDIGCHHVLWPVMLYGFVGSWILGTGRRLFPISLGWRPRWPRLETPAFALYQLGAAAWAIGAWPDESAGLRAMRAAGALLLLGATPVVVAILGLGGARQPWARPGVDRDYERYVGAAWAWLFVGLAAGPLFTVFAVARADYGSLAMLDFSRHTVAVGFATQFVMGIGSRFVPAFTGGALWSPRAHRAAFWLLNLAVALRGLEALVATGLWPGAWPLLSLSGPPVVLAVLLFALNVLSALRPRPLGPFRPIGPVAGAPGFRSAV